MLTHLWLLAQPGRPCWGQLEVGGCFWRAAEAPMCVGSAGYCPLRVPTPLMGQGRRGGNVGRHMEVTSGFLGVLPVLPVPPWLSSQSAAEGHSRWPRGCRGFEGCSVL